ncbi:hypothetical protein DPEC_G00223690 [Dallia pectoralis]|uniref:Uncharacterized protein n=1 Tax=Dallia pectoralis TaxID=75939 RepID=A0ACC2G012_DALPE|nr:hypothetical protein DPEC_G00223690 [Dallia pectoralis]
MSRTFRGQLAGLDLPLHCCENNSLRMHWENANELMRTSRRLPKSEIGQPAMLNSLRVDSGETEAPKGERHHVWEARWDAMRLTVRTIASKPLPTERLLYRPLLPVSYLIEIPEAPNGS